MGNGQALAGKGGIISSYHLVDVRSKTTRRLAYSESMIRSILLLSEEQNLALTLDDKYINLINYTTGKCVKLAKIEYYSGNNCLLQILPSASLETYSFICFDGFDCIRKFSLSKRFAHMLQ